MDVKFRRARVFPMCADRSLLPCFENQLQQITSYHLLATLLKVLRVIHSFPASPGEWPVQLLTVIFPSRGTRLRTPRRQPRPASQTSLALSYIPIIGQSISRIIHKNLHPQLATPNLTFQFSNSSLTKTTTDTSPTTKHTTTPFPALQQAFRNSGPRQAHDRAGTWARCPLRRCHRKARSRRAAGTS